MKLFPNPVRNQFTLQLSQAVEQTVELAIYNAYGQVMETRQLQPGTAQVAWDTDQLPAGTYWLKLDSDGIESKVKTFTVVK